MLTGRTLMLFLVALVLAILAVLVARHWVESVGNEQPKVHYDRVIVAAMDIPQWKKIEELDVIEKDWPTEAITADMLTEKSKAIGRIAVDKVFRDEPLNVHRVIDANSGNVFSLRFAENKRAFSLRVNDVSGVGGFVMPDDRVDVLAARKLSAVSDEVGTQTVAQNMRVLAIDQETSTDKKKPVVVRSITLEMSPQQAEDIFKAQMQGSIQIALRNPTDQTLVSQLEKVEFGAMSQPPQVVAPTTPTGKTFTVLRGMRPHTVQCTGTLCSERFHPSLR